MTNPDGTGYERASIDAGTMWSTHYWDDDDPWIFAEEARDHVERLLTALPISPRTRLLDFGCGFGFVPLLLAPRVREVAVWDSSAEMRRRAATTLAGIANVRLLDLSSGAPPQTRFDLILVNSVIQYMTEEELGRWLRPWHDALEPDGMVVLSDVWPPRANLVGELFAIVRFAIRRRILGRTLVGGLRRGLRHRRLERDHPLLRINPATLQRMAAAADLRTTRLPSNLTYRRGRFSFVLRPMAADLSSRSRGDDDSFLCSQRRKE